MRRGRGAAALKKKLPAHGELIISPYDHEARNRTKRDLNWNGYLVHVTETCADGAPHFITHVETTPSNVGDNSVTATIHQALEAKGLSPEEHFVDAGYLDGHLLAQSRVQGEVELIGPVGPDNSWQHRQANAFDISCFAIDWQQEEVTCPQGKTSHPWRHRRRKHDRPTIEVHFARSDCGSCPERARCTKADHRVLQFLPQPAFEALQEARAYQETDEFRERYKKRAGIEGTLSQGVRVCDVRRSRYRGLAKTHLQHIGTTAAIDLGRYAAWRQDRPIAQTRTSRFGALQLAA